MSKQQNTKALQALAAEMGFDLVPAKAKKAKKMPKGLKAAKKHCYTARINRAEANPLGGLTKAHRQTLSAELGGSGNYTAKQWAKAVKKFKAQGRHL